MRGINLFEQAHIAQLIPAKDGTGGANGDIFNMKNHRQANIILGIGVSAAAATKIFIDACSNANGDNAEAIAFDLYAEETDGGDTWAARQTVTAAGYTPSANNNIAYGIFLDAAQLPDDKPWVRLRITNGTNSVLMSAFVILTGERYTGAGTGISVLS